MITNSLKEIKPELLSEWNYSRNSENTPEAVKHNSSQKVWWICKNNHEWECSVGYRSKGFGKCKACKSLFFLRPDLYAQLHPTKNEKLHKTDEKSAKNEALNEDSKITELTLATSPQKVWWLGECGHEWDMTVRARVKSSQNCPYCSGQRVLEGFNDMATTHPELAKQWGLQNLLKPTQISQGSKIKVVWTSVCGHSWAASPNHRIKLPESYCQVCRSVLFTRPQILEMFNQTLNPHIDLKKLTKSSDEKIQWEGECGHVWSQKLSSRLKYRNDCLYCSNQKLLEGFNDLATTNPELTKEWDFKKNKKLPTEYPAGSQQKAWWLCTAQSHSWYSIVSDRNRGSGCPKCSNKRSKGEIELYDFLRSFYKDIEHSRRDLLSNRQEIDIYIPSLNIGVEYNGDYWHSDRFFSNHKYSSSEDYHQRKKDAAAANGVTLLFIWESDWLHRKEEIKEKLTAFLNKKSIDNEYINVDEIFEKI